MTSPSCNCAHVQQIVIWTRGRKEPQMQRHDRCIHPSGPHPMHEFFCAWKVEKREGAKE
jgi:hypothetical protein